MNSKTPSMVLPQRLLESFFKNKPIRFSVVGVWAAGPDFYQDGTLDVALSPDGVAYLRVTGRKPAPSESKVWGAVVTQRMLDLIRVNEAKTSFEADWRFDDIK